MKNTTNNARVKTIIREHIKEFYSVPDLKQQVKALIDGHFICTPYQALYHMAEGGCFLIYNGDIEDFLKSLDISNGKQYDYLEQFRFYCHLIARDGQLLVK